VICWIGVNNVYYGFLVVGLCFVVVVLEEFVVRVFRDGKVTVPVHVRELCGVCDGDYVRLGLVEVIKRAEGGEWVKRRVE
jgi:hypothetical protein